MILHCSNLHDFEHNFRFLTGIHYFNNVWEICPKCNYNNVEKGKKSIPVVFYLNSRGRCLPQITRVFNASLLLFSLKIHKIMNHNAYVLKEGKDLIQHK